MPRRPSTPDAPTDQQIVDHYRQCQSLKETGIFFDMTAERIRQILAKYRVSARAVRSQEDRQTALRIKKFVMERHPHSYTQISRALGISYFKVVQLMDCNGLSLERRFAPCGLEGLKIPGGWQVLERCQKDCRFILCQCECGIEKMVQIRYLKSGQSRSCHSCAAKRTPDRGYGITQRKVAPRPVGNSEGRQFPSTMAAAAAYGYSGSVIARTIREGRPVAKDGVRWWYLDDEKN